MQYKALTVCRPMCLILPVVVVCAVAPAADPDVDRLIGALRSRSNEERQVAILRVANLGVKAVDAVPELIVAIQDGDEAIRVCAKQALVAIGTPAIAPLERLVGNSNCSPDARYMSLLGLAEIEAHPSNVVFDALKSQHDQVRLGAAVALGVVRADGSVKSLAAAADDTAAPVRAQVAQSLGSLKSDVDITIPALKKLLKDSDAWTRTYAAEAVANFGADAASAKDLLMHATEDEYEIVRVAACRALSRVSLDRESLRAIIACLNDTTFPVREAALLALARARIIPASALPRVISMVGAAEGSPVVRACAARVLGVATPPAIDALPALRSAAKGDEDEYVRKQAAESVTRIVAKLKQKEFRD